MQKYSTCAYLLRSSPRCPHSKQGPTPCLPVLRDGSLERDDVAMGIIVSFQPALEILMSRFQHKLTTETGVSGFHHGVHAQIQRTISIGLVEGYLFGR